MNIRRESIFVTNCWVSVQINLQFPAEDELMLWFYLVESEILYLCCYKQKKRNLHFKAKKCVKG